MERLIRRNPRNHSATSRCEPYIRIVQGELAEKYGEDKTHGDVLRGVRWQRHQGAGSGNIL